MDFNMTSLGWSAIRQISHMDMEELFKKMINGFTMVYLKMDWHMDISDLLINLVAIIIKNIQMGNLLENGSE